MSGGTHGSGVECLGGHCTRGGGGGGQAALRQRYLRKKYIHTDIRPKPNYNA